MKRTVPQQTITTTNTPQPLFSTTLTASIPGSSSPQSIAVTSSVGFKVRDRINLSSGTVRSEDVEILAIADSTHITAVALKPHTNGDFVSLYFPLSNLYVQTVSGNSGSLFVGNSPLMTAALWLIAELTKVTAGSQPTDFYDAQIFGANPGSLIEYWVYGTSTDKYTVSLSYC